MQSCATTQANEKRQPCGVYTRQSDRDENESGGLR